VESHKPHDGLFRAVFQDPEVAGSLLRATLPAELVRRIDWSSLTTLEGALVDPVLAASQADLVFRGELDGSEARLVLLLEHFSRGDPLVPYRLLRYVVRIWEREKPVKGKLPLIVPVVLSQGRGRWRSRRRLTECIEGPAELIAALGPLVPELGFSLRDLAALKPDQIRKDTDEPLASLTQQVLRAVRLRPTSEGIGEALIGAKEEVRRLLRGPRREKLEQVLRYTLMAGPIREEELRKYVEQLGPEAEALMKTGADWLREEGEARGRAEGEARGRAESVLRQFRLKFGPPTEADEAKLRNATVPELERYTDRILTANSPDELFG